MIRKIVMLALVGIALLSFQSASAAIWGSLKVDADNASSYVERYQISEATLTITYQPLYFALMPIYAEVAVTNAPSFLTVIPTPQKFVLRANEPETVKLIMLVKEHDTLAGNSGSIEISVTGNVPFGGLIRTVEDGKASIAVGYNPFTVIALSTPQSIARTSPDKELPFIINVVNYGNSRVIVDLTVEETPGDWKYVISPSTVIINPKQPGDETFPFEPVYVTLTSPHGTAISYHNDWEDFSIRAKATAEAPYYTYQGGKWVRSTEEIILVNTHDATSYFLAKNRGFYVPGFEILFLMAGVIIAGVLFSKKKK
jgi:hypothetical protein